MYCISSIINLQYGPYGKLCHTEIQWHLLFYQYSKRIELLLNAFETEFIFLLFVFYFFPIQIPYLGM